MKAAVFKGVGKSLAIEEVAVPVARPGELVLRVHYCGVCGSDLHATHPGLFLVPVGTVLGHEFSGEIVESKAPGWNVGEMVTALPNNPCGECYSQGNMECKEGLGILCACNLLTGFSTDAPGALAQYVKVSASQAIRLPEGMSALEGALIEPLAVGFHAVDVGQVKMGARVLILGAGPIGLAVAAFAKQAGARDVIVSEYVSARREIAKQFGATAVIDPTSMDVGAEFLRISEAPPDIVFDCVGVPGTLQKCIDLSRPRGKIVVVGVCMSEDKVTPMSGIFKEVNVQFVMGYDKSDWQRVLDFVHSGRVNPHPMVTEVIELEQLPQAFEALRKPAGQVKLLVKLGA